MKSTTQKVLAFDIYGTLIDVQSVKSKCEEVFADKGAIISQEWRKKQLEYTFLRTLMGRYRPFSEVTRDALRYVVKEQGLSLSQEQENALLDQYIHLEAFPEVKDVLSKLKGKTLVAFSNGSLDTLVPLLENSGLKGYFDKIISVDDVKQYKPSPVAYMQVLNSTGVEREQVTLVSSNGFDISGGRSFGFNAAWINRKGLPQEELGLPPTSVHTDLKGILELD